MTTRAVILDWAGTTVDHGSRAPARVFVEIFARCGVAITDAEARGPMGMAKRDHIIAVAAMPRVAALWRERFGRAPNDADVQAMYDDFMPLQQAVLATGSEVIPGIPAAIAELRRGGWKIGSTTGYPQALMAMVAPRAARAGYAPDVVVCADDVVEGRPSPAMNRRAAELLGVTDPAQMLVVDDTAIGIEAGLRAGGWTVAVTRTGNALGLSVEDVAALPADELRQRLAEIERAFRACGANSVIESVADLPALVEALPLERRGG